MQPDRKEIAEALEALAAENDGFLRPADVVRAATPMSSPLHHYFQWNDTKAAHEHRLHQARQLLRVTVLVRHGPEAVHMPIFTSLSTDRGRDGEGYRRTTEVKADASLSLRADLDVLAQCERLLARTNSPRLSPVLHTVALAIADLEFGGAIPVAGAAANEEATAN